MKPTSTASQSSPSSLPPDFLPARMSVLFITGPHRTGQWLAEALAADSASEVELVESVGLTAGVKRLRDEVFDAVLISHEPGDLDALEFLEVVRTGSHEDQPVIVLGAQSEAEMTALSFEVGADAYVCANTTTTRTLIWHLARAVQRCALAEENRRLQHAQSHQLQLEREEARRLLQQQQQLVDRQGQSVEEVTRRMPSRLIDHYRDLMRAYIIMGSGNLHMEMAELAGVLATARLTAHEAMAIHLRALGEVIGGLGNRSARHVMNRADLMGLEITINLAHQYRQKLAEKTNPPRQQLLPGFEKAA